MKDERLRGYRGRRDFGATPEPEGTRDGGRGAGLFVVHRHGSRSLHCDLRLELDGVLKSWAVPKGPSVDPSEKRLAVRVDDHPAEYAGFEGVIPRGEYGAGAVIIWDRGFWVPGDDPYAGLEKGRLKLYLGGVKLKGGFSLVRFGRPKKEAKGPDEWLLMKEADDEAAPGSDILVEMPWSVASGKTLEEVAALSAVGAPAQAAAWAPRQEMADKVRSALAQPAASPPPGGQWLHELKYDGYRLLARIRRGQVSLFTRNGNDWTGRFPSVTKALSGLPVEAAWLDGEAVAFRKDGTTSFSALQEALAGGSGRALVYMVFDIVHYNGYDLGQVALSGRKSLVASVLRAGRAGSRALRYSEHLEGDGQALFESACARGAEGIVSKRKTSPYASGRSGEWLKTKCRGRQEFVVGGFTSPARGKGGVGALLLGVFDDEGRLIYCGRAGTGFTERAAEALGERLAGLRTGAPAFHDALSGQAARGAIWVRPELVVEVEFREWTRDHAVRHASFKGVRDDRLAPEVRREKPAPPVRPEQAHEDARQSGAPSGPARPRVTSPGRVYYPEDGYTKRDLMDYYETASTRMLAHVSGRPLTLVRCPDGYDRGCFFQKRLAGAAPSGIRRIGLVENDGTPAERYTVDTVDGLLGLVQLGVLEIHGWGSRARALESPDRLTFDIDPGDEVEWARVVEAAFLVRALLGELGLKSFVKSTGGKGLHIVAPVLPGLSWPKAREFAKAAAVFLSKGLPGRFTSTMAKSRRAGRIFVDYMRNDRGATAIEPYSTRAKKGAPIAAPLGWEELAGDGPAVFTLGDIAARMRGKDPWHGYMDLRQGVTDRMMERLGMGPGPDNPNRMQR